MVITKENSLFAYGRLVALIGRKQMAAFRTVTRPLLWHSGRAASRPGDSSRFPQRDDFRKLPLLVSKLRAALRHRHRRRALVPILVDLLLPVR